MHSTARVIALLAVLSCAATMARAQYPQRRDGFWIGFGLGYGSANITCDNCVDSSSVGGITGFVRLGGAPSRNLLIGGGGQEVWLVPSRVQSKRANNNYIVHHITPPMKVRYCYSGCVCLHY